MGLFQQLNRLGILSVGRRPEWQEQTTTTGEPSGPSAGVPLRGAVKTLIHATLINGNDVALRIWLLPSGVGDVPSTWAVANGGVFQLDEVGLAERLSTAGYSRIYLEIIGGDAAVAVGPGVME